MDQFQYRSKARVIAIVDLILTSMTLFVPITIFLMALALTVVSQDDKLKEDFKEKLIEQNPELADNPDIHHDATSGFIVGLMWFLFILSAVVVIVQLVAAIKLINATQIGKDPLGAAKLSRVWRNVTIVFTVLTFIGCINESSGSALRNLFNWGSIVLRIIGIYVVQKFITELDQAAISGVLPTHQGQVPMSAGMAYSYIPPQQEMAHQPPNYSDVVKEPYEKQ